VFTPEQHRAEAADYTELAKQGNAPNEARKTATLRAQIARFLRKHTNGHDEMGSSSVQSLTTPSPTLRPTSPQPEDETNSSEVSRLTR
jgi:hypothetical protein